MKKTILITGANGFLGRNLCQILKGNYKILAISRSQPKFKCIWLQFKGTSIANNEYIFRKFKPNYLIHCAGIAHKNLKKRNIGSLIDLNLNYTKTLAKLSKLNQVERFIYISSVSIYEFSWREKKNITENSEINPSNIYGKTKLESEIFIQKELKGSNTYFTIFRPPILYGKNAPGNIFKLIKLVDKKLPLPFGNFNNKKSLLSVNNFASAINISLENQNTKNKIYNLSDDEIISTLEIIKLIIKSRNNRLFLIGVPENLIKLFENLPYIGIILLKLNHSIIIDNKKFKNETNWEQPFSQKNELEKCFKETKY